jgi:thioesterase domain-containing protein
MREVAQPQGVRELAATRPRREDFCLAGPPVPPASDTERQLVGIWESVLDIADLGVEDDFFELGGDSLAAVSIFSAAEQILGEMPPLSILLDCPTIRSLARQLDDLGGSGRARLLMPVRSQGHRATLFHFHAADGNVLFVRRVLPFLDPDRPVFAVRARGLREGEVPHNNFAAFAADYVEEIRRRQPAGPYFLAGHCAGAFIALEIAQRLTALGQAVGAVIMIDPENHPNAVPWLHWRNPDAFSVRLKLLLIRPLWLLRRRLQDLLARIARRPVISYPSETGANLLRQRALHVGLRQALVSYRPAPYAGRLVILCSAERIGHLSNPALGWRTIAPQVEFIEIGSFHGDVFLTELSAVGAAIEQVLRDDGTPVRRAPELDAAE